jgi:hypothetical protein
MKEERETEQEHDDYLQERRLLSAVERENQHQFEKAILALSSAFLAFSLSLLGFLRGSAPGLPLEGVVAAGTLAASWVLFGVSVLAILLSNALGGLAARFQLRELERRLDGEAESNRSQTCVKCATCLYVMAGACFALGLVALVTFGLRNLGFD